MEKLKNLALAGLIWLGVFLSALLAIGFVWLILWGMWVLYNV